MHMYVMWVEPAVIVLGLSLLRSLLVDMYYCMTILCPPLPYGAAVVMQHPLAQEVVGKDIAYEKIMAEPKVQLQILADALDVGGKASSIVPVSICVSRTCSFRCYNGSCSAVCYTCVRIKKDLGRPVP